MDISSVAFGAFITFIIYFFYDKRGEKKVLDLKVENAKLIDTEKELQISMLQLQEELGQEREKNKHILSQKKSSETRLGGIGEHLAGFLEQCPHDPRNMHFLGNPLDYIVFNLENGEIIFLEIKTGNSKLSKKQKLLKNIIKSGRVYYEELRIGEKQVKHKRYDNLENSLPLSGDNSDEQD